MSVQKMFGVRDVKAKAFLQPFFSVHIDSAIRAFSDAVNDKNSQLARHPEDYILYEIGDFDDASGSLMPLSSIHMLGCGKDFVHVLPSGRLPLDFDEKVGAVNGSKETH